MLKCLVPHSSISLATYRFHYNNLRKRLDEHFQQNPRQLANVDSWSRDEIMNCVKGLSRTNFPLQTPDCTYFMMTKPVTLHANPTLIFAAYLNQRKD